MDAGQALLREELELEHIKAEITLKPVQPQWELGRP